MSHPTWTPAIAIKSARPRACAAAAAVLLLWASCAAAPLAAQDQHSVPPPDAKSVQSAAEAYAASVKAGPDPRQPMPARPGALTIEQVVDLAKGRNPAILAAEENLRAVRGQELQAAVRANPYFTLVGSDVSEPASAANPYNYSAQFSRLFERGQKRRWRIDDAKATSAETEAQLNDTIRQTVLTVKKAFTTMLVAKASLELDSATLNDFQHEVQIGYDRFKAGDLAKLDYERLDLQLASFEGNESTDLVALRQASYQLQTLIGVAKPTEDFDITGDVVPPILTATRDTLEQKALDARPDFRAAQFAVAAADANYKLAVANGTADPTLEVEYDRNGTENSAGFQINIPLRFFDRNQGNKVTAKYQASSARFNATATRNQVSSDVDQAWIGYTEAKRLSERYSSRYLDESRDVLNISQYAFEHGGIALIDYLDAVRDFRTTTAGALTAYENTWIAIHQLAAATNTEVTP